MCKKWQTTANQSPQQMCEEGEDVEVLLRTADEMPLFLREGC